MRRAWGRGGRQPGASLEGAVGDGWGAGGVQASRAEDEMAGIRYQGAFRWEGIGDAMGPECPAAPPGGARISEIRAAIASGAYDVDARLDGILDALLEDVLGSSAEGDESSSGRGALGGGSG